MRHSFADLANDVVIDGDVVYVVGMSTGQHDKLKVRTRGIIVAMDLHTGEVIAPVIVAPVLGDDWKSSAFFGATSAPGGVLVTGYAVRRRQLQVQDRNRDLQRGGSAHVA